MLVEVFRAKKEHYLEAAVWLGYHVLGSLLPVWLGILLIVFVVQPFGFADLIDRGEFAIYSAAIITPVIYALLKDRQSKEKDFYVLITLSVWSLRP